MSSVPRPSISPEEYLVRERRAAFRSEYYRGEMFAMAGGSRRHSLIKMNIGAELRSQLKGRPCTAYDCDLRLRVAATGLYTYPDFSVVCDHALFDDALRDTILNPTLLIEVLSDSTEAYDRGEKFEHYKQIPELREYVLVSQNLPRIERFARNADGTWTLTVAEGLDGSVALPSIGVTLHLAEVYDKVDFAAEKSPE